MNNFRHYIIRFSVNKLRAGDLVYIDLTDNPLNSNVVRLVSHDTGRIHQTYINNVLPMSEYLKRRPKRSFFVLGFKYALRQRIPHLLKNFKNMAKTHDRPFRFESVGEIRYYMKERGINPRSITIQEWNLDI